MITDFYKRYKSEYSSKITIYVDGDLYYDSVSGFWAGRCITTLQIGTLPYYRQDHNGVHVTIVEFLEEN